MTRVRINMTGWTEEQKKEHRLQKGREKAQKWRAANTEKHREQVKEWQENNLERLVAYQKTRSARQTERLQNDPIFAENRREQWRRWAKDNAAARDEYKYERRYGFRYDERDRRLALQNFLCQICSKDIQKNYQTDHCHKTGKVRGFLCMNCNTILGLSGDNPTVLRAGAEYLER